MELKEDPPLEKRITRRTFLKRMVGLSGDGEDASLLDTVKLSTVFTLGVVASTPIAMDIMESTGINFGHADAAQISKFAKDNPLAALAIGSVMAPIIEESVFRILPSISLPESTKGSTMWRVGIPTSLAFAGMHSVTMEFDRTEGKEPEPHAKLASVPIYQFIGGLFFWKLARERGYLHAIAAHSTANTILFSFNLLAPADQNEEKKPTPSTNNVGN